MMTGRHRRHPPITVALTIVTLAIMAGIAALVLITALI